LRTFVSHDTIFFGCSFYPQFTRDALIVLAGSKEKGRDFVYWTEVKDIPATDLATMERLWNKFSGGKFGYSVQKVRPDLCRPSLRTSTFHHDLLSND